MHRLLLVTLIAACGGSPTRETTTTPPVVAHDEPAEPVEVEVEAEAEPVAVAPAAPSIECAAGTRLGGQEGVEVWCERPDGVREGAYQSWDARGQPAERGEFVAGVRDGSWVEFFEGRVSGQGPYRRGKKHGVWRHRGDHFELEVTWNDGVEGKSIEFVVDDPPDEPFDLDGL
jgi:hypothetical protein